MNTIKSYHYKLQPNKDQESMLNQWLGTCRYLYNLALEYKIMMYTQCKQYVSKFDLINQLPEVKKVEGYEWIKNVSSQTLQSVIERLDNSFQRFFKLGTGFPKFAKKYKYKSFLVKQGVEIHGNCIKLPKIGLIKFFNSRQIESKIKTATIRKEADGWYISLVFEGVTKDLPFNTKEIGLDLGIKYFAVTSNEDKIANPRTYRKYEADLATLQRSKDRKEKGSKNKAKIQEKISRLHQKIANIRKDFLDKVSTKLIRENQVIVVEDLKISNLVKSPKPVKNDNGKGFKKNGKSKKSGLSKSILDAGWGIFTNMLEYKAKWYGRTFVKVAPHYTSRDCSHCGYRCDKMPLSIREWQCSECKEIHDRDFNASKNILKKWRLGEPYEAQDNE